jgi:hypothetical protein
VEAQRDKHRALKTSYHSTSRTPQQSQNQYGYQLCIRKPWRIKAKRH